MKTRKNSGKNAEGTPKGSPRNLLEKFWDQHPETCWARLLDKIPREFQEKSLRRNFGKNLEKSIGEVPEKRSGEMIRRTPSWTQGKPLEKLRKKSLGNSWRIFKTNLASNSGRNPGRSSETNPGKNSLGLSGRNRRRNSRRKLEKSTKKSQEELQ